MAISHLTLCKSNEGRQAVPCGKLERPQSGARERESNHSLSGPCIHPDPATAKARAGDGPRVGKDDVENGNSLNRAAKLNPEVLACIV